VVEQYLTFKADQAAAEVPARDPADICARAGKPLHSVPVHKVERADVAVELKRIAKDSGGISANRAQTALSSLYSWAMREGLTDTNPVIATNRQAAEVARERVLTDPELATIWNALPDTDYGRIVKLLVLTGQRREEIGGLHWSEIDLDKRMISLPASRTKNKRPHDIPLSDSALEVLSECQRRARRPRVRRPTARTVSAASPWPSVPSTRRSASRRGSCTMCVEPSRPSWARSWQFNAHRGSNLEPHQRPTRPGSQERTIAPYTPRRNARR